MTQPTHDTPEEREAKAEAIASSLRRFRWEMRFYILFLLALILLRAF